MVMRLKRTSDSAANALVGHAEINIEGPEKECDILEEPGFREAWGTPSSREAFWVD